MLLGFLLGVAAGAIGCLGYLAIKKQRRITSDSNDVKGSVLYLNVLILDKKEGVQRVVTEK